VGDETKRIGIKVKAGDKEVDVEIEIDEGTAKGSIKVGRDKTNLTGLKKGKDGKRVEGKTKNLLVGELSVVITIDCDKDPAEIHIVATDKKGKVRADSTYTFTHAEQDRLVEFLNGTKIPELALAEPPGSEGAVATGSAIGATLATVATVAVVATLGLYLVWSGGPGGTSASPTPYLTPTSTAPATPTESATPSASPTPTTTQTPTTTPAPTARPVALTLTAAPPVVRLGATGATVRFQGTGFTPEGRVTKTFLPPRGRPFSFETTADATGRVTADLELTRDQPIGTWSVTARDEATGQEAETTFEVRP